MTKELSYWLDTQYIPRPPLSEDIKTDVVVVGGGITGISVAYHCAKLGLETVLLEKELIASGSAGKNGGMVVEGLELDFYEIVEKFGAEKALKLWNNTIEAREHLFHLVESENIDCDLKRAGSLYMAEEASDLTKLEKEADTRRKYAIQSEIIEKAGLYNKKDCMLNPVKLVRGLATAAEKYGAMIYENTPAVKWDSHNVETAKGRITADRVILALESYNPILPAETEVICSQAIVTGPISDKKMKELDWKWGMFWTTDSNYISGRRLGNRLFSCKSLNVGANEQEKEENREWQVCKLISLFPSLKKEDLTISHAWNGLMLYPRSHHSIISDKNGYWEIFGHGGNGLTKGISCGKMLAESFSGISVPEIYKNV